MKKPKLALIDPKYSMWHAKKCTTLKDMKKELVSIHKNGYLLQYISKIYFPKKYERIGNNGFYLSRESFETEFLWLSLLLDINHKVINSFVKMEEEYDVYLLTGQYDKALKLIDVIDNNFGVSVWSIEQRINILELNYGTDVQRDFTNALTANEEIHPGVRLQLMLYGWRAEKNISYRLYNFYFRRLNDKNDEYLWFKANFYGISTLKGLENILAIDMDAPLIDMYQNFLKMCQYIFVANNQQLLNILKKSLKQTRQIVDERLVNLRALLLHDFNQNIINSEAVQILDNYTSGKYEEVIKGIIDEFKKGSLQADYPEILAKACIKGKFSLPKIEMPILEKIISNMEIVLLKGERYHEAIEELLKIITTYQSQKWTTRINTFLLEGQFSKDINRIKAGFANTFFGNPLQGYYIQKENQAEFFRRLKRAFPLSPSITLHSIMTDDNTNFDDLEKLEIPQERKTKYTARMYRRFGEVEREKELYLQLICNADPITNHDATIGLLDCFIDLKELREAIRLVADCAIENTNYLLGLPINRVLDEIERVKRHDLWGDINLSIAYHVYSKFFGRKKDGIMAVACERFLKSNGYKRPSEIDVSKFSKPALIYYLRNVCVIPVLDASYVYAGSEEVEKERILVCQLLSLLDIPNANEYTNEIKKITQRIAIKQNIRKIEDGKIYVDTEGIKSNLVKTLGETYVRFMSIESHNLDTFVMELRKIMPDMQYRIFNDEKRELFESLFLEFRNHFTAAEYGLENCLSTGIRHGVIGSSLRKPFEVANLITVKDAVTGEYLDNEYWKNRLNFLSNENLSIIMEHLAIFSKETDLLIETLRTKWIQIRTEVCNEEGVFDFKLCSAELKKLQKECEEATSFEEFSDIIFGYFWELTNRGLVNMRQKIDLDFKRQFNNLFDNLLKDINCVAGSNKIICNELCDSIAKARTDLQHDLHRIVSWFERSSESKIADYDIELPINIGVEIINNINPTKRIEPDITIKSKLQLKGNTLRSLVDVIYILLENSIKHSCVRRDELKLSIAFQDNNGEFQLEIENIVSDNVAKLVNMEELSNLKNTINNGVSLEKARSEGGSGFFKIAKILKYDLKCPYHIDFGFSESPSFWVKVKIDFRNVLV